MRHLDPKKGRFCISECLKHDLVQPFPVLESKKEEIVAHFKATVLITANAVERVTGLPPQKLKHDKKMYSNPTWTKEEVEATQRSLQLKKKAKKKKKKGGAGEKD
eukprot:gene52291-9544_t